MSSSSSSDGGGGSSGSSGSSGLPTRIVESPIAALLWKPTTFLQLPFMVSVSPEVRRVLCAYLHIQPVVDTSGPMMRTSNLCTVSISPDGMKLATVTI